VLWAAVGLGLMIGAIVGAVGGGGAILALPVLVYLLGEEVGPASTASLIVVAVAAAVGAGALALRGHVCLRLALAFAAPAAAGSLLGTIANGAVGARLLVLAFVPVMLIAAAAMWSRDDDDEDAADTGCPPLRAGRVVVAGLGVGALTGFFGVGGGFMIVPVLMLWFDLGLRRAIATSLVIITLTGVAALASHLVAGAAPDAGLTAALAGGTAVGALGGTAVAQRLPKEVLGRAFALVLAVVAVLLLVDVLALGGPPGA
jgi:uncharacterized membrane protein YfcA